MKKLVILISIAVIICFAAAVLSAQNNMAETEIIHKAKCSLFFKGILNGHDKHLEHFDDHLGYLLNVGSFWENCLLTHLNQGEDISITYIGYTKGEPTKTELKYLIKSAVQFKEELEDYIEEQAPDYSFLNDGDRYIALQTDVNLNLPKAMQKIIKKENKKFDIMDPNSKIFINIKTEENPQHSGDIFVEIRK